jgi:hypothetical protein
MIVTDTVIGGAIGISGVLPGGWQQHRWAMVRERRAFTVLTLTELQEALDSARAAILTYAVMSQVAKRARSVGVSDLFRVLEEAAMASARIRSRSGLLASGKVRDAADSVDRELTDLAGSSPTAAQLTHFGRTLKTCSDLVATELRLLQAGRG